MGQKKGAGCSAMLHIKFFSNSNRELVMGYLQRVAAIAVKTGNQDENKDCPRKIDLSRGDEVAIWSPRDASATGRVTRVDPSQGTVTIVLNQRIASEYPKRQSGMSDRERKLLSYVDIQKSDKVKVWTKLLARTINGYVLKIGDDERTLVLDLTDRMRPSVEKERIKTLTTKLECFAT